jgi:hypothetical protein
MDPVTPPKDMEAAPPAQNMGALSRVVSETHVDGI